MKCSKIATRTNRAQGMGKIKGQTGLGTSLQLTAKSEYETDRSWLEGMNQGIKKFLNCILNKDCLRNPINNK
jgi:hypothetical protein